jgi:hypothetical protein
MDATSQSSARAEIPAPIKPDPFRVCPDYRDIDMFLLMYKYIIYIILILVCVQTGSGAHPASCTMGTGGPFPGAKSRPGRDADHSPLSSAEVENE